MTNDPLFLPFREFFTAVLSEMAGDEDDYRIIEMLSIIDIDSMPLQDLMPMLYDLEVGGDLILWSNKLECRVRIANTETSHLTQTPDEITIRLIHVKDFRSLLKSLEAGIEEVR